MATDFKDFLSGLICSPVLDLVEENKTAIADYAGSNIEINHKDKNKIVFQPVSFMCFYPGDCEEKESIKSIIKADYEAFMLNIFNVSNDILNKNIDLIANSLNFHYILSSPEFQYRTFNPTKPNIKEFSSAIFDQDHNKGILTLRMFLSVNVVKKEGYLFSVLNGDLIIEVISPK